MYFNEIGIDDGWMMYCSIELIDIDSELFFCL